MGRHGSLQGRIHGAKHGARHNDKVGGGISVQQDGGIYFPASALDFVELGLAAPTSLWPLQETSGSLVDVISGVNLTVTGTPNYAQAVAGFATVKGFTTTQTANQRAANTTTAPNSATTSTLTIVIASGFTGIPPYSLVALKAGTNTDILHLATDRFSGRWNAASTAQVVDPGGLRFIALQSDRTNSAARLVTDQANTTGSYSAGITGVGVSIGAASNTPPAASWMRMFQYTGAAAELSAVQIKAIGQALGFTFAW